ncbi:MAG: hypothetical protein ABL956_13700 [Hyphomonadaceae bacterium]
MPRLNQGEDVRPVDMEIGGDDDTPGISQELTTDDVDDVAFDAYLSVGKRQRQLMGLLEEMRTRRSGDYMGDVEEIASHIRDRLASLGSPQEGQTRLESTGTYPDDRSDDDDPADHIADEEPEEDGGP